MHRHMKTLLLTGFTAILVLNTEARVRADYAQNFDSGSATFTVNDPYWLDPNAANGFITKTTNTPAIWPGFPGGFGGDISQDASGTGFFLFDGTYFYPTGGTIPAASNEFFISPSFAVTPNTNYTVTFDLTNADANGAAQAVIQPELGGSLLGSPVSAVGVWGTSGWQQFTYSWNSGANTSASLILHDFTQTVSGNDFGIDEVAVTAVPEPTTFLTLGAGAVALFTSRRRRR